MKRNLQKMFRCFSRHRVGARALSLLLTVLLIFYVIPATVYAEVADAFSGEEADDTATESTATVNDGATALDYTPVLYEVADLREEGVKHFHLEDGSYVAAQYAYPVHYLDDSGKWQDIDNSLAESGGMLANSTARIKFVKKITGNSSLFTLHDGNTKLTMSLIGAKKGTIGEATNYADAEADTKLQKMMNLEKLSSRVLYEDILDGVDIEYIAQSLNVKENIIVKERADAYSYTFELVLNNLTAALADNGDVVITDSTGAAKYTIPAPVVYDAAGVYAPTTVSRYSLESSNGNGKYLLTVTVDSAWMNSVERTFPVTVDPTIAYRRYLVDVTITNTSPDTVDKTSDTLTVSPTARSYIPIGGVDIDTFIHGYISSIKLCLKNVSGAGNYIGAYASYYIDEDTTWNDMEGGNDMFSHNSFPMDCQYIDTVGAWYTWDVTSLEIELPTAYAPPAAILLMNMEGENEIRFASAEAASGTPYLLTQYTNMMGVEEYWPMSSHSIGNAGTGAVNLATGNLNVSVPTLSTKDSLFASTVTLVYNIKDATEYYNHTEAFMPRGFRLNICQSLEKFSYVDGISYETVTYYVYTDADGTEHALFATGEENIYKDEDGLKMELDTSTMKITTSSKSVYSFAEKSTNKWYLTTITDISGNSLIFTFDSQYRPTLVSVKPNGLNVIDYIQLHYNSAGKLVLIYDPTANEGVALRYDGDLLTEVDRGYGEGEVEGTLDDWLDWTIDISHEYQDGFITATCDGARYTYDYYGYMSTASDFSSGYRVEYDVEAYHMQYIPYVESMTEYGENSYQGQKISFSYGGTLTTVRSSGNDEIYGNADDVLTKYCLDEYGRATSVYSTDLTGATIYGAVSGEYENVPNRRNNLKHEAITDGSDVNYLLNGDFEDTVSFDNYWTTVGDVTKYERTMFGEKGFTSARLQPTATTAASMSQRLYLKSGDYTLSMPVSSAYCENCVAEVVIKSIHTQDIIQCATIPLNVTSNGSESFFSTTFNVSSVIDAGDNLNICIKITGNSSSSSSSIPYLIVDNVMLENGIGSSKYNMVEFGGFDGYALDNSGDITCSPSNVWSTETGSAITVSNGAVKVIANLGESYVKQRIYELSASGLSAYDGTEYFTNSDEYYIVSGFASASRAVSSGDFRIRVVVTYYQGDYTGHPSLAEYYKAYVEKEFIFSSQNYSSAKQFISGVFNTYSDPELIATASICVDEEEKIYQTYSLYRYFDCISSIDVYCEYSNQATGYATFDNICVTNATGNDLKSYVYDNDTGYLTVVKDNAFEEYYKYENDNLTRVANNRGELTNYTYDSSGRLIKSVDCDFVDDLGGVYYPYREESPDEWITQTPKTATEYTYNSYGLLTQTKTYQTSDGSTQLPGTKAIASYSTYDTTPGSYIFGALLTETNGTNIGTRYLYDSTNGLLMASLDMYTNTGVCYTYDISGRLSGVTPATYSSTTNTYTSVTNAESVRYSYTGGDRLYSATTGSTEYLFTYDSFGNQETVKAGDNTLATYEYNDYNGKLKKIIYGNGLVVEYVYNSLENLEKVCYTYNSGTENESTVTAYEYEYTSDGSLYKFRDLINDETTVYQYDNNGKLINAIEYADNGDSTTADGEYEVKYHKTLDYTNKGELHFVRYYLDYTASGVKHSANFGKSYHYGFDGKLENEFIGNKTISYTYDDFGRLIGVEFSSSDPNSTDVFSYSHTYTYRSFGNSSTDALIESYTDGGKTYTYTYDSDGNISTVNYRTDSNTPEPDIDYRYDDLGQLTGAVFETSEGVFESYVYTYDNAGNIIQAAMYTYSGTEYYDFAYTAFVKNYTYSTSEWGDLLVAFNGNAITYDQIGNPLSYYNGATFGWTGRRLTSAAYDGNTFAFTYDDNGVRQSKTKNGVVTTYYYDGNKLVAEVTGNEIVVYLYDASGSPIGMRYRNDTYAKDVWDVYWYEKNLQGDILGVYNSTGTQLVSYRYDPWGKVYIRYISGGASTSAAKNSLMYRGYYYDKDLGLYYLISRYYDANIGRFISADGYVSTGQGLIGYNMFAYCGNNPINRVDPTGEAWWHWAIGAAIVVACAVATVVTCGGFAAAAGAVVAVGSGVAAATTASTVAAGAFIGASLAYGTAVCVAAANSNSVEEFNEQGTWETVAVTAVGAVAGGTAAYFTTGSNSRITTSIDNDILDLPRTGSALKSDPYHAFPDIIDNYAGYATQTHINNGVLYQIQGSLNGVVGRFEWIVQSQQVVHRYFVEGGGINGIPIRP